MALAYVFRVYTQPHAHPCIHHQPTNPPSTPTGSNPGDVAAVSPTATLSGGSSYVFDFYAKTKGQQGRATVQIQSADDGRALASATFPINNGDWEQYKVCVVGGEKGGWVDGCILGF